MRLPKALLAGLMVVSTVGIATPATDAYAARPVAWVDPGPPNGSRTANPPSLPAKAAQPVSRRPAVNVSIMSFNVCGGVCRHGEVARTAAFTAHVAVARKAEVVLLQELCYSQFVRVRSPASRPRILR